MEGSKWQLPSLYEILDPGLVYFDHDANAGRLEVPVLPFAVPIQFTLG